MAKMDEARNQDDLTAERAAALFRKLDEGLYYMREGGKSHQEQDKFGVDLLLQFAQQTRQDALREAANKVRDRALLWGSHGGAKIGFPYGHLTIEGEYESMASALDRLASEGG